MSEQSGTRPPVGMVIPHPVQIAIPGETEKVLDRVYGPGFVVKYVLYPVYLLIGIGVGALTWYQYDTIKDNQAQQERLFGKQLKLLDEAKKALQGQTDAIETGAQETGEKVDVLVHKVETLFIAQTKAAEEAATLAREQVAAVADRAE